MDVLQSAEHDGFCSEGLAEVLGGADWPAPDKRARRAGPGRLSSRVVQHSDLPLL